MQLPPKFCYRCGARLTLGSTYCTDCRASIDTTEECHSPPSIPVQTSLITVTDRGDLQVTYRSLEEAKLAVKALKLKKKEYALLKREITNQQRMIRASYTDEIRRRGSKFRRGGWVGRIVRDVQTASRDALRHNLAAQLAPLEQSKNQVDAILSAIGQAILQIELHIAQAK